MTAHNVLFLLLLGALVLSLIAGSRQFFRAYTLVRERDGYRARLVGPGGRIMDAVESEIGLFESALFPFRAAFPNRDAMDAIAVQMLKEDARAMSHIAGYGRASGWAHVFRVLANIRSRLMVCRFVLDRTVTMSRDLMERIDRLQPQLTEFAALNSFYYDFYQANLLAVRAPVAAQTAWPEIAVAETLALAIEQEAQRLMAQLEEGETPQAQIPHR